MTDINEDLVAAFEAVETGLVEVVMRLARGEALTAASRVLAGISDDPSEVVEMAKALEKYLEPDAPEIATVEQLFAELDEASVYEARTPISDEGLRHVIKGIVDEPRFRDVTLTRNGVAAILRDKGYKASNGRIGRALAAVRG